jgi:hypothetical protein
MLPNNVIQGMHKRTGEKYFMNKRRMTKPAKTAYDWKFPRNGRLKTSSAAFGLGALLFSLSVQARAQGPLTPVSECIEYANAVTPAPPSPSGTTPTASLIYHFGYFNSTQSILNLPTDSSNNFISPDTQDRLQATTAFYPGWHAHAFRAQFPANSIGLTWFLGTSYATAVPFSQQSLQATPPKTAAPTCPAIFQPSPLTFTAPGTYPHQYLGQVEAGPPVDVNVVVTAAANTPNVALANLTYVAADPAISAPANPGDPDSLANIWNPNSVYGDVTIAPAASGSAAVVVSLTVNGRVLTTAISNLTLPTQSTIPTMPVRAGNCPVDVTNQVSQTMTTAKQTLGSPTWTESVIIKNTTTTTIAGPILIALTSLSSNAGLFAAGGYGTCSGIAGAPYAYVTGALAPGASAAALLTFTNSQVPSAAITFTPVILSGGSRM